MSASINPATMLQWYLESGVNETSGDTPVNHLQAPAEKPQNILQEPQELYTQPSAFALKAQEIMAANLHSLSPTVTPMSKSPQTNAVISPIMFPAEAVAKAKQLAEQAKTIAELKQAVLDFDGCLLKKLAKKTVFSDGNENAKVMLIGEAPGETEDEQGIPFCGKSGQLLDNVLRTIGLTRAENLYISNTIFWRPPGNRTPTPEEVAICAPFVQKHIALKAPDLLILAGGVAGSVLGITDSVSKMRGQFHCYTNPYLTKEISAVVIYHPSYLLRSPGQKAAAWKDMQMIQEFLDSN